IGNGTGLAPGFTLTKGTPGLVIDMGTVNGQTTTIRNLDIGPGSVPAFWSTTNSRIVLVGDASGFPGSGIIVTPRGRAIIVGNSRLGNGSSLANFNGGNGLAPGSYTTHNAVTGNLPGYVPITVASPGDGITIYSGGPSQNQGNNIGGINPGENMFFGGAVLTP